MLNQKILKAVGELPILYDYYPYDQPRKGLFSLNKKDGEYIFPDGWEVEEKEVTIIGETNLFYVYKLSPSEQGRWVGDKVIVEKFVIPHGINKLRFIKWTTGQLELF